MKISFIGHAAILIETKGVSILSDPWWMGPCFGVQWWVHPDPWLEPIEAAPPDFIYVSHGHSDHLHNGTLQRLPKSAKVLVSDAIDIGPAIADLGFEVVALSPHRVQEIASGVKVEITPTYSDDTLMVVDDGEEVCFNLNDAVHATPLEIQDRIIDDLTRRYGRADYVFCGYGTASHFPNCYIIPGKDKLKTAGRRQSHFNHVWSSIMQKLEPRFGFPFAADVIFFEDELFWSNEPVHNLERPTDVFAAANPESPTVVCDIAPGFVIQDGAIASQREFTAVDNAALGRDRGKDIATANKVTVPTPEQIEDLAAALRKNVEVCLPYLEEYRGDYRMAIVLKGTSRGIELVKSGGSVRVSAAEISEDRSAYDVVFTTRFSYLRRTLTTQYGHEVIFVGSGGIFSYRDRQTAATNLHRELTALLRKVEQAPKSRFGDQPRWLYLAKRLVKRLLGRVDEDLYDLDSWTVYEGAGAKREPGGGL